MSKQVTYKCLIEYNALHSLCVKQGLRLIRTFNINISDFLKHKNIRFKEYNQIICIHIGLFINVKFDL